MWRYIHVIIITCVYVMPVLEDLVLMPVHTKPEDSVKELDELYDVFQDVKKKWKTDVKHYAQLQYLHNNHAFVETLGFFN